MAAAEERHVVEDDGRRGRNGHRQIPDLALLAYKVVVMLEARIIFKLILFTFSPVRPAQLFKHFFNFEKRQSVGGRKGKAPTGLE